MKNNKLKPIIKANSYSINHVNWIIEEFPQSYQDMVYLDLFCDNLSVYVKKDKSKIEIINDTDIGIIQVYRAIKDEYKHFVKKINAVKCNIETFDKFLENANENFDDYLDKAVNEFVLRKFSKLETKESFINKKIKWNQILNELTILRSRLQETFITNKEALEIIHKFNNKETFIYCNLPINLREQHYNKMFNQLNNSSSKILITCKDQKLAKKLFSTWNCKRKMFSKGSSKKLECLWKNY